MANDQVAVTVEEVLYTADSAEIRGLLYRRADQAGPRPAVAILHGGPNVNQQKSEEYLSRALARHGYVVLAGTYRQRVPSDHDGADVAGCLAHLAGLPGVDAARLGMAGHSRGGFATLRLAGHEPHLKSAVALAAGTGVEDADERMKPHCFSRYVELFRYGGGTPESNRRRRTGLSPGPAELERIRIPVLWVHGTRDFNNPPDGSVRAHEIVTRAGNPRARLELISGMDHFWGHPSGPQHDRVADIVVRWFDETL